VQPIHVAGDSRLDYIGAGPTGLTAAIYASRRMMKTLVIKVEQSDLEKSF